MGKEKGRFPGRTKKYEVLGNLTPGLPSLRGPADSRLTIMGPTGRHKKGCGGGGKAKGVRMRHDGRRGSGLGPRHGWASVAWVELPFT